MGGTSGSETTVLTVTSTVEPAAGHAPLVGEHDIATSTREESIPYSSMTFVITASLRAAASSALCGAAHPGQGDGGAIRGRRQVQPVPQ